MKQIDTKIYCIRCHKQIFKNHPCPWCKDKSDKEIQTMILRDQNQALNKWMRKFF
jgi:hypothetical protein